MEAKQKQALKEFLRTGRSDSLDQKESSPKNQSKKRQSVQEAFVPSDRLKTHQELAKKKNQNIQAHRPVDQPELSSSKEANKKQTKEAPKKRRSQKASSSSLKTSPVKAPIPIKSSPENLKEESKHSAKKSVTSYEGDDNYLKSIQARRLQMMSKMDTHTEVAPPAPLQIQLMQSESLKISQEKINSLEEELVLLREKSESLLSVADLLKEQNQELKVKVEESEKRIGEEKIDFENEKEILLSALSSAKEQIEKLKKEKKDLDAKLSSYSYSLSHRENSLEGRIEILKMENSVLQREKDKKIIELRKSVEKNKRNLEAVQKQNQELRDLNEELQKSSHRAVSALRATIFNLEGVDSSEDLLPNSKDK